jgi:hypothetical protein
MEPIPLRTLTVLLNYERVISDPRFKDVRLMSSSIADPGMIDRMKVNYSDFLKSVPKTVEYVYYQNRSTLKFRNILASC